VLSEKELLFASVQVTTPFAGSNIFTSSLFLSAPADSTIDGNLGEKGQSNSMQQSNFTYTLPWRNYIENKKRRLKYELTGNEVRFLRYEIAYNASYILWLPDVLNGNILK
jgi:hypothetical protein